MNCILTIGFNNYFINIDNALTIVSMLEESVQVDSNFRNEEYSEISGVKEMGLITCVNTCKLAKAPVDDVVKPETPPKLENIDDDGMLDDDGMPF